MKREKLARLLDRVATGDEDAQAELLEYIMQQPEGIQALALEALEDGDENTYDQLMLTLADDPNLVIRKPRRRERVEEEVDLSEFHEIAQQAMREWQQKSAPRAPEELIEQLHSGDRNRQVQAARALAEYSDPATVDPLVESIRSGDRVVAAAAVETLQEIGPPAVPALVTVMEDSDEQVRWHAAKALSTLADERAVDALITALDESNYGIRWLAAEGLAQAGRATILPLLRRLADKKPSAWLRQGAWHALNKLNLPRDDERQHYKQLGRELKRSSAAAIPNIARQEIKRLGEDA